jgi:S-formylglutathione hydrolase FrmB
MTAAAATTFVALAACGGGGDPTSPFAGQPPSATLGTSQVVTDSFYSPALGVTKHYLVYLPPSYASSPSRRFPVAYLLHGSNDDETGWMHYLDAQHMLDSLAAKGKPEVIAVMPDGDNSYYRNWVGGETYSQCLVSAPKEGRDPATFCVQHRQYEDYIVHDLVANTDGKYRTVADARHRGIEGVSMGGEGAVFLSVAHPDVFGSAASLGGAFLSLLHLGHYVAGQTTPQATTIAQLQTQYGTAWPLFANQFGTDMNYWRANDAVSIVQASVAAHRAIPNLWLVVGANDNITLDDNQIFNAVLSQLGVAHSYTVFAGGDHSIATWGPNKGPATAWLMGHIGG